ncbi:MAG: peroxiredoxin [Actinobacteria bacterium]|nr:peroxiredoxin [Actinomycetota bacterium]
MLIGRPAPDFRMLTTKDPNTLEHEATLADYQGRWLLLFFYPSDFTFVCPTEMLALNAALPEFADLDCDVLGVSTDGVFAHIAWMEFHIGALDYPLASDRSQVVSRAYGVLEDDGRASRAVFLVDPEGVVRFETLYDDRVGRSIDELLRVLQALRKPGRTFAQYTSPPRPRDADCNPTALTTA